MSPDTLISVIAPLQDDGPIIQEFVADVCAVLRANYANYELVLVDDYSTDGTLSEVEVLLKQYPCIRLIRLSGRFGTDVAVTAGLDTTIGDYVVVLRPQSDPPQEIPAMVRAAAAVDCGVVLGTSEREAGRGRLVSTGRAAFYWLLRRVLHSSLPPDATGFCVLSRPVVNAITRIKSKYRHLGFLACAVGYAVTLHPYRQLGRSPHRKFRPLRAAIDEAIALLVNNSVFPLRLVSYVGTFAGSLNLLYVLYIVAVNLVKRQVSEGWTTLSLQMSCMFFFTFLNLVILSEYIAHILHEAQNRPHYHVLEERISSVRVNDPERRNVA